MRQGEVALYRLHGVLRSVTDYDGEHGAPGDQRRGRGHGGAQVVRRSVTSVLEQGTVVKHSCGVTRPSSSPATVVVVHGAYRSSAAQWACPSASW